MAGSSVSLVLNGISIPCADITDQHRAAVVRHQYPGHSGAELEFLGMDASEVHLRAVFVGAAEIAHYVSLLEVMRLGETVVVEHPQLGKFDALLLDCRGRWSELRDAVEADISLVKDGIDQPLQYKPRAIQLRASLTNQVLASLRKDWSKPFAPNSPPAVDLSDPSWAEKLNALGLGNKISSLVSRAAAALGRIDALTAAISSPVSAAFNALAFASDLPGQLSMRVATLLDLLGGRVEGAPDPVTSCTRFAGEMQDLIVQFRGTPLEGMVRAQGAMQVAGSAAAIMDEDEQRLRAQVSIEAAETFDARGNWLGRSSSPGVLPATADDVGSMVTAARSALAAAMPWVSDREPLLRMALALHTQYCNRLVEFEQLREIVVPTPTPLHVILSQNGLPYNMAERLARLNNLRNPSFVVGKVRIYAAS